MTAPPTTLVFVYNADSSPPAQAFDFIHKAVSPETYKCNLCRVTYGTFKAKKEWTEFIKGLPCRTEFLHRDEFRKGHPALAGTPLPAIFIEKENGKLELLAGAEELAKPETVVQMTALILSKLA